VRRIGGAISCRRAVSGGSAPGSGEQCRVQTVLGIGATDGGSM